MKYILRKRNIILTLALTMFTICTNLSVAQEPKTADKTEDIEVKELVEFIEDCNDEIDFYSLEEMLDVEAASLFVEDEIEFYQNIRNLPN